MIQLQTFTIFDVHSLIDLIELKSLHTDVYIVYDMLRESGTCKFSKNKCVLFIRWLLGLHWRSETFCFFCLFTDRIVVTRSILRVYPEPYKRNNFLD